jgi:pseudaminic acid cytidylyltransferase
MLSMGVVAIIPARGGSKRLPRKNVLPLLGKPLIQWVIKACIKSNVFEKVLVSTDDMEISGLANSAGANVILRPDHMATDEAHESLAYMHVLNTLIEQNCKPSHFCAVYPTAVLLEPSDFKEAYKLFKDSDADALMSVTAYDIHPYKALTANKDGYLEMIYPEHCKQRSQTYPHYVASNGTFYFFRTESYLENPNYYPEKLIGYEISSERAVDVDTIEDFNKLKNIMKLRDQ